MKRLNLRKAAITCVLACFALGLPLGARADYASTVAGLNPVVYYRLSTTNLMPVELSATNIGSLGNAFNGQYQAMSESRSRPGAIVGDLDTAVETDGANKRVVVPYSAAYNPQGAFTVEAWLNPGSDAAGLTAPLNAAQMAGNRSGWLLYQNGSDGWSFRMYNQNGGTFSLELAGGGPVAANTWYHVVATYDGTTATLYVNGTEALSGEPSGTPSAYVANTDGPLVIGARSDFAFQWKGRADEVAIYTTALSGSDVLAHYQNGTNSARSQPYDALVKSKTPALYYRLDEPSLQLPVAINSGSFGAAANGTYRPGSTPGVPGPQMPAVTGFETTNVAVGLDGINGIVQLPGIPLNSDTVTFVCWIKPDGAQAARATIMHQRKVTEPQVKATGPQYGDDGRTLSYNWEDNGSDYTWNPGFAPPDNAWTFVVVAVSPDDAVMYMGSANGLQAATNTVTHSPHDFSGTTMELGWDNYQAARKFRGVMDEFAMFDKTLTPAQVKSLFDAAQPAILGVTRTPADPVYEGMTVTFTATVAGTSPAFQWRKNGQVLSANTNANLTLNSVVTNDSGSYDLVVTSGGKTVTSSALSLIVLSSLPIITQQPVAGTRFIGGAATLAVSAVGTVPLTYQWYFNSSPIAGATASSLGLPSILPSDAGDYYVRLTNPYGITNSVIASLTVVAPTNYGTTVMAAGPVAYWGMNETSGQTAMDGAGGYDAVYVGNVTNGVAGPGSGNTAYQFNGVDAYLEAPTALDVDRNHFTITAWIKVNAWDKTWQAIVTKGDSSWRLHRNNTTDAIGFGTTGLNKDQTDLAGNASVADGQWHHVAAVYDGAMKSIYVDGALDASVAAWGTVSANNYPVRIGENAEATGRYFNGSIDEVALYSRALSLAEVQELYRKGTSTTLAAPQITQQPLAQTVFAGQPLNLSVTAIGGAPYTYQWKHEGTNLPGEVGAGLNIRNAAFTDAGAYTVVVSNSVSTATSQTATMTVLPTPQYANITNGLVLHLKFDSDYKDSSGRGNDGTPQGSPAIVPGKIGSGALHYTTVVSGGAVSEANYVSLGMPADLQFGTNVNFSVAFWIKFIGAPGDLPFLANNSGSMGGPGVTIAPSYNEGGWSWGLNDSVTSQPWPGIGLYDPVKNTLNDGNWHNLVHTFDRAGNGSTYLDGVLVHSMSIVYATGWDMNTGMEWDIGQAGGSYAEQGDFTMDDLGIWRRALLPAEAESIYLVGQNYGRSFDVPAPAEVRVQIQKTATGVQIQWPNGTLESSDRADGGFAPVPGATPPSYLVEPATGNKFFRVKL